MQSTADQGSQFIRQTFEVMGLWGETNCRSCASCWIARPAQPEKV